MSSGEDGGQPGRWGGGWWPPASRPRPVENGLKARSTRGAISQTWWSGRFIAVLEDMGLGGRLERGRNYARRGQVISLDVAAGMASALVQGSRVQPYRVRVGLTAFGVPEWARLERALAASAWYSAKLLSGEMPEDIEDVFAEQGLTLFPATPQEMSMYCSCPDWQVPCKHIAAVFYLLAESFDDDPFAILAWRGRGREELLAGLHAARGGHTGRGGSAAVGAGGSGAGGSGAAGAGGSGAADAGGSRAVDAGGSGAVGAGGSGAAGAGGSGAVGAGGAGEGGEGGEGASGAAGRGERSGVPLADCLGSFFAISAPMPVTRPPATTGASLLDQLPPLSLTVRGRALAELLGPAYDAFTGAPPP